MPPKPTYEELEKRIRTLERIGLEKHQGEQFLSAVINAADSLLAVIDKDFRIVKSNWKGCDWISDEQRESKPHCYKAMRNSDFPCTNCQSKLTFLDGLPRQWEDQNPIDGRYKMASATPIFNDKGEVEYVVHNVKDITERKLTEMAVQKSEEQFRLITENMLDCIAMVDAAGNYQYVSPSYRENLGYTSEEMIGISGFSITHPDDLERVFMLYVEGIEKGVSELLYETRIRHKDGHYLPIEIRVRSLRDSCGKIVGGVLAARDISKRKEAMANLQESEEKFRITFDASPDAISITRLEDGVFTDINSTFTQLTGYTQEYTIGKTPQEIGIWDDFKDSDKMRERLKRDGFCNNLEAKFRRKDGSATTALMSSRVISLQNIPHIIAITKDITDYKDAEKERERLQSQLYQAQKMESIGRLAGGVAHDFNNMLGVIMGHAEMIMDSIPAKNLIRHSLEEIQNAASRSKDLTRQLLAYARKQTITPKVLDLNETIEGILKILRRLIGEDIELVWKPLGLPLMVKMDPSQIDQILTNLCVNSRDAIDGAGCITIETGKAFFDDQYCQAHQGFIPGEYAVLTVKDNGSGMDDESLEHLFEPFFTTKDVDKGTGLGLAMVYGIVQQNNGFINVNSEPGQGTSFEIYFQRHRGAKQLISTLKKGPVPKAPNNETILLVEDEPGFLKLSRMMLKRLGYNVLTASNPKEAIALAENHDGTIHLLMTDVVMPEINGRDLSTRLKKEFPGLQCLFMSGYTADTIAQHGVLEEGVFFLEKPFSLSTLALKIREILEIR